MEKKNRWVLVVISAPSTSHTTSWLRTGKKRQPEGLNCRKLWPKEENWAFQAELQWEHQSKWRTGVPQGKQLFQYYTKTLSTLGQTTQPLQWVYQTRQVKTFFYSSLMISVFKKQNQANSQETRRYRINLWAKLSNGEPLPHWSSPN